MLALVVEARACGRVRGVVIFHKAGGGPLAPNTRDISRDDVTIRCTRGEFPILEALILAGFVARIDPAFAHYGKDAFRQMIATIRPKARRLRLRIESLGDESYQRVDIRRRRPHDSLAADSLTPHALAA